MGDETENEFRFQGTAFGQNGYPQGFVSEILEWGVFVCLSDVAQRQRLFNGDYHVQ